MAHSGNHPADSHDLIGVTGARVNNLQGVDVTIPKRRLTAFTGVSGSGKSSLVFDTIAAESQRMINETYPAFVQGFMPTLARPDVDRLEGLTPAIIVDQEPMGANVRSTVGTATDANALLRILFASLAQPSLGSTQAYAFNVASATGSGQLTTSKAGHTQREARTFTVVGGMCPRCDGTGQVQDFDLDALFDRQLSLSGGALRVPGYSMDGWYGRIFAGSGYFDMDKPLGKFSQRELDNLLHRAPTKIVVDGINLTYEGIIPKITKTMLSKDVEAMQPHIRAFVERAVTFQTCPECDGTRLTEAARNSRIGEVSIADACRMQVSDLLEWLENIDEASAAPVLRSLRELLGGFVRIGLGYLSLERPTGTLSGGEAQRVKMIRHLGSALTDVTYVFDEPSAGLHPHDISRMNDLLLELRDKGNTVLVVEHKPETIQIADHVIDLGPGAGTHGGTICFEGTVEELRHSQCLTGRHFADRVQLKDTVRPATGQIEVRRADRHNLKDVDVDIPLGVLCVITGVAGSGKSSLVNHSLPSDLDVVRIDQGQIKGSRRSNPATWTGMLDPIRKAFAKANGVKPALFSANSEGACPQCRGAGTITAELGHMESVTTPCEQCQGKGFQPEVLSHTLGGLDIHQTLQLSVEQALEHFQRPESKIPAAVKILQRLVDVGLDYLTIGQPLSSLSGGERQRLKLASQLDDRSSIVVLDEPTAGLHLADVEQLLTMLDRLVDQGASLVVVEHHQAVMAHADWIIDMGPGAGHDGGEVVFEGTPSQLVADRSTLTGQHLAAYLDI